MRSVLSDFMQEHAFCAEAVSAPESGAEALFRYNDSKQVLCHCRDMLFRGESPWKRLNELTPKTGVHPFSLRPLFFIFCTPESWKKYQEKGLSRALFHDSMKDLKFKMEETHQVYGVWGVYCGSWLSLFLLMRCFCLGRLQFEMVTSDFSYEISGFSLRPKNPLSRIHVPSFGKLDFPSVLDAYRQAAGYGSTAKAGFFPLR